jgi:hypothetical protein
MVLSKVVTAESLKSNGIGGRINQEPHYNSIECSSFVLHIIFLLFLSYTVFTQHHIAKTVQNTLQNV